MKNKTFYLKNTDEKMYEENEWEYEKSLKSREEYLAKKKPTSVALSEETIAELKALAGDKGIPYQVLIRNYIIQGIKNDNKSS